MNLLGDFLQARRALVRPEEFGITSHGRRRVAGLRREELAELAGISRDYLMRLEQGRDRHPSPQVLDALARALRLDADATSHLHSLAAPAPAAVTVAEVPDDVQRLLDAWATSPAYVRDARFDVRAANKAAMLLAPLYTPGRNLVRDMFQDPQARRIFADWPLIAEQTVAALRAQADLRDPSIRRLVADLQDDPDFARWWERQDVRPTRDELKRFVHPDVGALELRRQSLAIASAPGHVVIVYQAEPGSRSADRLADLLR